MEKFLQKKLHYDNVTVPFLHAFIKLRNRRVPQCVSEQVSRCCRVLRKHFKIMSEKANT